MGTPVTSLAAVALTLVASACSTHPEGSSVGTDAGPGEPGLADSGRTEDAGTAAREAGGDASSVDARGPDGGAIDASGMDAGADGEGLDGGGPCFVSTDGVSGQCSSVAACTALGGHTSTPGYCPGPANIECCTLSPDVADNPPVPAGWQLMPQSAVTPAMTTWAVAILNAPTAYPMFSTTTMTFGALMVLARVEWHPPDFQNSVVHRGVTLYEPG